LDVLTRPMYKDILVDSLRRFRGLGGHPAVVQG